jgi:hypothetical protein
VGGLAQHPKPSRCSNAEGQRILDLACKRRLVDPDDRAAGIGQAPDLNVPAIGQGSATQARITVAIVSALADRERSGTVISTGHLFTRLRDLPVTPGTPGPPGSGR